MESGFCHPWFSHTRFLEHHHRGRYFAVTLFRIAPLKAYFGHFCMSKWPRIPTVGAIFGLKTGAPSSILLWTRTCSTLEYKNCVLAARCPSGIFGDIVVRVQNMALWVECRTPEYNCTKAYGEVWRAIDANAWIKLINQFEGAYDSGQIEQRYFLEW